MKIIVPAFFIHLIDKGLVQGHENSRPFPKYQ